MSYLSQPGSVGFEPEAVRAAFSQSAEDFVGIVGQLADKGIDWDIELPSGWNLRTVVAHTSRALSTPVRYLQSGAGQVVTADHPFDYFKGISPDYSAVDAIVRRAEEAALALGSDPAAGVATLAADAVTVVAAADDDAPVATPSGVMSLVSYLPSRVFVLTTDAADLASTFALDYEPPEAAANLSLMMSVGIAVEASDAVEALTVLVSSTPRVLLPREDEAERAGGRGLSRLRFNREKRSRA